MTTAEPSLIGAAAIITTLCLSAASLPSCATNPQNSPASGQTSQIPDTPTKMTEEQASSGIEAVVNGSYEILSSTVDALVESNRVSQGFVDDEGWAEYLRVQGMDESSYRKSMIDSIAQDAIVEQAAAEKGIEVTAEEVANYISSFNSSVGYSRDEAASAAETRYGSQDAYKRSVKNLLLSQKLKDSFKPRAYDIDDASLIDYVNDSANIFDGQRYIGYYELVDTSFAAQVYESLENGAPFASLGDYHSVGVEQKAFSNQLQAPDEVKAKASSLSSGESVLVVSGNSAYLVHCYEQEAYPDGGFKSISEIGDGLKEYASTSVASKKGNDRYNEYIETFRNRSVIVYKDGSFKAGGVEGRF